MTSSVSPKLTCQIPFVQVGDSHVTFSILSTKGEATWQVKRRFNDFIKLQTAVKKQVGKDVDLPELPPKAVRLGLSKFDPDFIEGRRAALESYLFKLVSVVDPERAEALDDFLDYAEHWLKEAVSLLGDVKELQSIVKMLKQAAETAALVHQRRSGLESSGKAGSKRRGSDDEDEDDRVPITTTAGAVDGPELIAVLTEVVRMMTEYSAMLRSQAEDADERSEATSASNSALTAKLRGKNEDIADALEMVSSLRQSRLRECAKERLQLQVVAQQVRTVAAELRRVVCEGNSVRIALKEHSTGLAITRSELSDWEKAAVPGNLSSSTTTTTSQTNSLSSCNSSSTASLSPLHQVAGIVTRAEEFKIEAENLVRKLSNKITIPRLGSDEAISVNTSKTSSGGFYDEGNSPKNLTNKASSLLQGSVLSGANLGVALLLQAVSLDSADLIECANQLVEGRFIARVNETTPKSQSIQQKSQTQSQSQVSSLTNNTRSSAPQNPFQSTNNGTSGGPPDFGYNNSMKSTTTTTTTATASYGGSGAELKSPGNPFGGVAAKTNSVKSSSVGNPF
jgi:hypothetical protein